MNTREIILYYMIYTVKHERKTRGYDEYASSYLSNNLQHALGKDPEMNPFRSIKRPFQRLR